MATANSTPIHIVDQAGCRCMRCGERLPPELAGRDDLAWHGVARHRTGEEGSHIWTPEQLADDNVGRVGYVLCEPQGVA